MTSKQQSQSVNLDPNRYPFWGLKIPKEVKYLQQACLNKIQNVTIERACYRELLKSVPVCEFLKGIYFKIFLFYLSCDRCT